MTILEGQPPGKIAHCQESLLYFCAKSTGPDRHMRDPGLCFFLSQPSASRGASPKAWVQPVAQALMAVIVTARCSKTPTRGLATVAPSRFLCYTVDRQMAALRPLNVSTVWIGNRDSEGPDVGASIGPRQHHPTGVCGKRAIRASLCLDAQTNLLASGCRSPRLHLLQLPAVWRVF